MTNQEAPQVSPEVPPQPQVQLPQMTPEMFAQIKQALSAQFEKSYIGFIQAIIQIPAEERGIKTAIQFLDTGYLWMKQAINNLPALPHNMQAVSVQPQPQSERNVANS